MHPMGGGLDDVDARHVCERPVLREVLFNGKLYWFDLLSYVTKGMLNIIRLTQINPTLAQKAI